MNNVRVKRGFARARTAEKQVATYAKEKERLRNANAKLRSGEAWEKRDVSQLPEAIQIRLSKKDGDMLAMQEEFETRLEERVTSEKTSGAKFLQALGKANERYSLTIVELGMELMQLRLSGKYTRYSRSMSSSSNCSI